MGTTKTLTGHVGTLAGAAPTSVHAAYVMTNLPAGKALIDVDDSPAAPASVRLGPGRLDFDRTTGRFTVSLLATDNTTLNVAPNTLRYQVLIEYNQPGTSGLTTWESGFFPLLADVDLKDVAPDVELVVASTISEQLAARIDGYVDHGNVSGPVTFSGPTGSHWFDATAATTVTLDDFEEGQVVTLICFSGADDVAVVDAGDVELVDATAWSAQLARGVWVGGGGGGTPAVPDSTPPSAVSGLAAVGGEGQVSASWSASTDPESALHYRWRVWLTSGGEAGEWTSTDSLNFAKTGMPAGAYTVQVYAYSSGGSSAVASTTATVTAVPGWSTFDTLGSAQTGADGSFSSPKDFTTAGARTIRIAADYGGNIAVSSGKIQGPNDNGGASIAFTSGGPSGYVARELDYDVTLANGSYPRRVRMTVGQETGAATGAVEWAGGVYKATVDSTYSSATTVFTAGPGKTLAGDGKSVDGVPASGRVRVEPVGQILRLYIDDALILSADFTNATYGTDPNPLKGTSLPINIMNNAAVSDIVWETYS